MKSIGSSAVTCVLQRQKVKHARKALFCSSCSPRRWTPQVSSRSWACAVLTAPHRIYVYDKANKCWRYTRQEDRKLPEPSWGGSALLAHVVAL